MYIFLLTRQHVYSALSSCFLVTHWTKAGGIKETRQSSHRCHRHLSKVKNVNSEKACLNANGTSVCCWCVSVDTKKNTSSLVNEAHTKKWTRYLLSALEGTNCLNRPKTFQQEHVEKKKNSLSYWGQFPISIFIAGKDLFKSHCLL